MDYIWVDNIIIYVEPKFLEFSSQNVQKNVRVDKTEHPELHIKRTMFLKTHIEDKLNKKNQYLPLGYKKDR